MDAMKLREEILALTKNYCEAKQTQEDSAFEPGKSRINYAGRVYGLEEMTNLVDAALEFWLTAGRYTREFETGLAKFLGLKRALFVNSGSSANLLAFMTLTSPLLGERRIRRGDEVITVAAGFPTTVAPIVQFGAIPVFVDVDLATANVDVTQLEPALSERTRAVMLAHTLGNPFRIDAVKEFCKRHDLWLIEDNCDALGSKYAGRLTGTWGDIGTSSFYPPHHMTTGEGGAVYTDDPLLAKIALSLRDWGRDCSCASGEDNRCGHRFTGKFGTLPEGYDHKYVYSHFGYNLKATDLQAAVGCAQLARLDEFTRRRRENFDYLYEQLKDLPELSLFKAEPESEPSWFGFLMTLTGEAHFTRNELVAHLERHGIQTRNLFAGNLTRHPCFETLKEGVDYRISGALTNTDKLMNDAFWIGVYPGMTREKLDYMIREIRSFCNANGGEQP
ncbi:lipopolysaccharide biosynthesis protein RfbH [uncultured Victivallis sp.]|uniref:lipopolysaccharide biosynthesis protein RfbH n=1 Tax=uncultured Victivallis sp. TaxID=354118 RepID=UPI0025D9DE94|nr:lipopolysaccharide biosynthesis protein RfbH [uncultured Victivallis sp.]